MRGNKIRGLETKGQTEQVFQYIYPLEVSCNTSFRDFRESEILPVDGLQDFIESEMTPVNTFTKSVQMCGSAHLYTVHFRTRPSNLWRGFIPFLPNWKVWQSDSGNGM